MEGHWILFYCYDNRNEPLVATCMKNGSWSPDPHMYKCHIASMIFYKKYSFLVYYHSSTTGELNSNMVYWHTITAIMIALIAVVLFIIISVIVVLAGMKYRTLIISCDNMIIIVLLFQITVYREHLSFNHKIKIDHPNYYSDLPSSEYNENQVEAVGTIRVMDIDPQTP